MGKKRPKNGEGHPWADFLHYRAKCIDWMLSEGKEPEEIARVLSMDTTQVRLIAARPRPKGSR
jgi:hypothetical protein